jgi:hypothetical protein
MRAYSLGVNVGVLTQLPQFEEKCSDFRVIGCRKSLRSKASVSQGAM